MNFVDTAITLLMETGRPMAVEELCKLAMDRGLLDKPGANPVRSMKTRLSVELKKGDESRVRKDDDEIWDVCEGVALPDGAPEEEAPKKVKSSSAKKSAAASKAKVAASKTASKATAAKATTKAATTKAATTKAAPAKAAPAKAASKSTSNGKARSKKASAAKSATAEASTQASREAVEAQDESVVVDAAVSEEISKSPAIELADGDGSGASVEAEALEEEPLTPPVPLTEEEQALVELYGAGATTRSAAELNEYKDELTQDEDRLMLPEIRAERHRPRDRERGRDRDREKERGERTRRRRRGRGEPRERAESTSRSERPYERDRNRDREREAPQSARGNHNGHARDVAGAPIQVIDVQGGPSASLVRSALTILSQLPTGQTMPVRQLTQSLIRHGLLEGQADQVWRMVKGVLLVSEQRRLSRGLHPLVRYHGKDLFSAGPDMGRSVVDLAAAALSSASENYAAAVEAEMMSRLAHLAPQMLERIAYVYLQETGWTDITWLKRVDRSSYALATAPGAVDETLIGVRSGPELVDRRGVGELRAGLHAKDLNSGLLLSPCELSEEADVELAREGGHVRVLCGRDWITELCAREVGITWRPIQVPQIDQRFLDAVLS